jgi:hypothetical protein
MEFRPGDRGLIAAESGSQNFDLAASHHTACARLCSQQAHLHRSRLLITARDGIDGFDCPEDLVSVPDRYRPSSQMPAFLAEGGTVVLFRESPTTCVAAKVSIPPYSGVWGGVEQGPKRVVGHVWTAPLAQEGKSVMQLRSGAVMCPAC